MAASRDDLLKGADYEGYEAFCDTLINYLKNNWYMSDPRTNLTEAQDGMIAVDSDDGRIYYRHSGSWYPLVTVNRSPNLIKSKYSDFQSFEDGDDIGVSSNGTAKCDTTDFYIGDRCLKMVAIATANAAFLGLGTEDYNTRLKPSTKYIVSFYAKAVAGTPQVRANIRQDDGSYKYSELQNITTSWARYEFIINTDANLTNSGLLILINYDDGATVWFDAIQIEEASAAASPEASPYKPSATVKIHGAQIRHLTAQAHPTNYRQVYIDTDTGELYYVP